MVTLSISAGGAIAIIAVVGLATYAFYRRGKKVNSSQKSKESQPTPAPQATLPNMAQAQKAFMSNIEKFIVYFEGVTNIKVDWDKLSEAIIDINDDDLNKLLLIYKKNPTRWIDQMATWGVKPESCIEFTAMDKHKKQYATKDGSEIVAGKRYTVLSACWLMTKTNSEGATIKEVLRKGIVEEQQ